MDREMLSDEQWGRIEGMLPGRVGHVGGTSPDNRRFVEAVLWVLRTGSPWRDLDESKYGNWHSVYVRFQRWEATGVWQRVFEALKQGEVSDTVMIDTTIVRAHQHAAGAPAQKGGKRHRRWVAVEADFQPSSMSL